MLDDIHYNRAFYAPNPQPGKAFRQIVILEGPVRYEILVFEGEVLRTEEEFKSRVGSIQVRTAATIGTARAIADSVSLDSTTSGWVIHNR